MNPVIHHIASASVTDCIRAIHYGDGFFETMLIDKDIAYWHLHCQRMALTSEILKINLPFSFHALYQSILIFARQHSSNSPLRFRLSFIRQAHGNYAPLHPQQVYLLGHISPFSANYSLPRSNGLRVGISSVSIPKHPLSSFKTLNALPYVLAADECKKNQLDEILMRNTDGCVADASAHNVFLRFNQRFITPPLDEACLNGVMRKQLMIYLLHNGFSVSENIVTDEMLMQADEIILTNVLSGLQFVASLNDKIYEGKFTLSHAHKVRAFLSETI
ncbi:MAG: aminotransferase class IV [Candidatus Competibacteraceae bacterium]|nr:aminotransferase class IV [Candidatus Competibacteraceae bacterium]